MRIRSIRPEFWSSEDIAALDIFTRLLFIGLWSYVDDNGVGRDVEKLIAADVFPLEDDPRDTLAKVSEGLRRLSEGGQITRFAVDGKPYLHIDKWDTHQRVDKPAKARYPLPTREDAVVRESIAEPSREPRETVAPGEGEKGRRGEESSSSEIADAISDKEPMREDVARLCEHLQNRIVDNGSKRPNITQAWRRSARLLLDKDGRTEKQVHDAIDWCQDDSFWKTNILSMPTLREKYDRIRLKALEEQKAQPRLQAVPSYKPLPLPDESELTW